jgi:hypothetical protein
MVSSVSATAGRCQKRKQDQQCRADSAVHGWLEINLAARFLGVPNRRDSGMRRESIG